MSKYSIENYRPTQSDVELLVVSAKAADRPVKSLLRQRTGDEWRVPDMPVFKTMDGLEHKDRDWVGRYGDNYAARVVLTPAGLELLAGQLIKELANNVYFLEHEVGRRELNEHYALEYRLDRALSALKLLEWPGWQKLEDSIGPEMEKARQDAQKAQELGVSVAPITAEEIAEFGIEEAKE